jgi:hypothetical protein
MTIAHEKNKRNRETSALQNAGTGRFLPTPVLLGRIRMATAAFTGALHLLEHSPQGINFLLVGSLLALGKFQGLEHFIHVLERLPEVIDDLVHQFDGLMHCGRRRGDPFARRFRRARFLDALGTLVLAASAPEITTILAFRRAAFKALRAFRFGLADRFRLQLVTHGSPFRLVRNFHVVFGVNIPFGDFRRRCFVVIGGVLLRRLGVQLRLIVAHWLDGLVHCFRVIPGGFLEHSLILSCNGFVFRRLRLQRSAAASASTAPTATTAPTAGTTGGLGLLRVCSTGT